MNSDMESRIDWMKLQHVGWMYVLTIGTCVTTLAFLGAHYLVLDAWEHGLTRCFRFIDPSFSSNALMGSVLMLFSAMCFVANFVYSFVKMHRLEHAIMDLRLGV